MPNYADKEGERIRVLLESGSPAVRKSVESALLEMGVDPLTAKFYGREGGNPEEIATYLERTKDSRTARLRRQAPPQSSVRGIPSPWLVEPKK